MFSPCSCRDVIWGRAYVAGFWKVVNAQFDKCRFSKTIALEHEE